MRTTTLSELKCHDPEVARRLYDDAVADVYVSRSLWRGAVVGLTLVGIIVAIAVTLTSAVL